MVNTELLKKTIESKGLKIGFIADSLGISRQAFDLKVNNKIPLKIPEAKKIADILRLTPDEINDIFLAQKVTKNHEKRC
jgi:transcriptional regulator with XRE-family HTH domain